MMKWSIKVVSAHLVDGVCEGVRRVRVERTEEKDMHMLALLPRITL